MKGRFGSHLFWGSYSPLSSLSGAGLLIMASSRFAFALVCAGALLWVYGFTALIYSGARSILPSKGRIVVLLFLSAFFSGLYALLTSFLNPLLIMACSFFLFLIPPWCLGSGFFESAESADPIETVSRALLEAFIFASIIIAFSLIREPLGMGTISIPGGAQGIAEIFGSRDADAFVPVRILSVSSGGLLLLGYGTALYRYFREKYSGTSEE